MGPYKNKFFSLDELKQPVNQWLCIAFLSLWVFWFMLYYVADKTKELGESFVTPVSYASLGSQELRNLQVSGSAAKNQKLLQKNKLP